MTSPTLTSQPAAANPQLPQQVASAAATAGLAVISTAAATNTAGVATTVFTLALARATAPTLPLELSSSFDPSPAAFTQALAGFLADTAARLRAPRPDALLTLAGLPLSFSGFSWPFHHSTAGADTSLVHGQVNLEDGQGSPLHAPLHAKIAAAMTVTFREIVAAPEQPFAESFILNAIRKTMDQGQIELVKSGNRQPVPVTTRYYQPRLQTFSFNETTEPQRRAFLAAKTFWLSGILGGSAPVWLADPRDAQYLNTTPAELQASAAALAGESLLTLAADMAYATPTAALLAREPQYRAQLADALAFIKPTFNEEMRAGHTNM